MIALAFLVGFVVVTQQLIIMVLAAMVGRSEYRRAAIDIDNTRLLGVIRETNAKLQGERSRRFDAPPSQPKPPASVTRLSAAQPARMAAPKADPPDEEPTEVWTTPPSTMPEAAAQNGRSRQ